MSPGMLWLRVRSARLRTCCARSKKLNERRSPLKMGRHLLSNVRAAGTVCAGSRRCGTDLWVSGRRRGTPSLSSFWSNADDRRLAKTGVALGLQGCRLVSQVRWAGRRDFPLPRCQGQRLRPAASRKASEWGKCRRLDQIEGRAGAGNGRRSIAREQFLKTFEHLASSRDQSATSEAFGWEAATVQSN